MSEEDTLPSSKIQESIQFKSESVYRSLNKEVTVNDRLSLQRRTARLLIIVLVGIMLVLLVFVGLWSLRGNLKINDGNDHPEPDNPHKFHLIAHSHDDIGWIVSGQDYANLAVSQIVRTSAKYVASHGGAKFSFCNIGFLKLWIDQDAINNTKIFKQAVDTGRMEILNGGYAVHDNAGVYFDDIVSTYEYGREFVWQKFGYVPRTGWLIDPFGLSLTTSRLYAEMGYDQFVMNRFSSWEREQWRREGQLHKIWAVENKPEYNLFAFELADYYQVKSPFDIDVPLDSNSQEYPIINILDPKFNLNDKSAEFVGNLYGQISWFNTKHILVPWGGDFTFKNFEHTYQYYEASLYFIRSNMYTGRYANDITFTQSTVEEYFKAVRQDTDKYNIKFSEKKGDFFPYIVHDIEKGLDDPNHSSWTGYFVSNPRAKKVIRSLSEAVRGLKSLLALKTLRDTTNDVMLEEIVNQAEKAHWMVGINTHHDTITGTSTNYAAATYLNNIRETTNNLNTSFNYFISKYFDVDPFASYQNLTLLWPNDEYLTTPRNNTTYLFVSTGGVKDKVHRVVNDWSGLEAWPVHDHRKADLLPAASTCNRNNTCEHVLLDSLAVGQGKLYVFASPLVPAYTRKDLAAGQEYSETVGGQELAFSLADGLLSFSNGAEAAKLGLHQYIWDGKSQISNYTNGKYIFCSSNGSVPLTPDAGQSFYTLSSDGSSLDVHLSYLNGVILLNFKFLPKAPITHRYSVRLASGILHEGLVESDTNFVIRYYSDIRNGKSFVTESNGLELLTRTFGINSKIIDNNYYPLTRFMYIQDSRKRLSVLIDRAQGGTSPQEGVIEIMFNRRSSHDDGYGSGEGTFEPETSNVLHYIVFDILGSQDQQNYRRHQVDSDNPVIVYHVKSNRDDQASGYYLAMSEYGAAGVAGVSNGLVRVLFDRRADGRLMVRLYNMDDHNTATLDLRDTLKHGYGIEASAITETGIDFNFPTSEMNKWNYTWQQYNFPDWKGETLVLKPLQIRTFEIKK